MELTPYLDSLRRDLAAAAAPGGRDVQQAAELLGGSIEASARLCLLEALSDAAAEITTRLDGGSVDVRLRGREAQFVVSRAARRADRTPPRSAAGPPRHPSRPPTSATSPGSRCAYRKASRRPPNAPPPPRPSPSTPGWSGPSRGCCPRPRSHPPFPPSPPPVHRARSDAWPPGNRRPAFRASHRDGSTAGGA